MHLQTHQYNRDNDSMIMPSPLPPLLFLDLCLLVFAATTTTTIEAFLFHHQPQHISSTTIASNSRQRWTLPSSSLPTLMKTAAAAAVSSEDNGRQAEDGDDGGSGGGAAAKPKPFLTRRMRRGPIGAAASISSNNKAAAAAKADGDDADAKPPAAPAAAAKSVPVTPSPAVLKVSKKWACIANCGACCYLAPSERPFLMEYFDEDPDDLAQYNSMVGDDGWCIHYDKTARACTVFEDRPWFCRVEGETFERMYGVTAPEMDKFCTSCCREQIGDVYGVGSTEMTSFNTAIKHLRAAADGKDGGGAAGGGGGKKKGGGFGKAAKESAAENARMAGIEIKPIDPFTGEVSDKAAAKADWI